MSLCCEFSVLTGRGVCVWLITRPKESIDYLVSECDRGASTMRRPWPKGAEIYESC